MTALAKRSISSVFAFDLAPSMEGLPAVALAPVESEIQLCRTGAFYRADMGHFKVTQRTLEKMVANAVERGVDIPINYYHKGGMYDAPIEERCSAGRVSPASLSIRSYKGGFGLFGVARWTAEAVSKIKAGEVQYISPEIEWAALRLAASDAGPAGESIGPLLSGAALVDDPFFTLNPVTLSRVGAPRRGQRPGAPKRYNKMWSQEKIDAITKAAKSNGMPAESIATFILALMPILEDAPMPEVEAEVLEEVMPAAAAATPATEGAAQQALAASRIREEALTKRLAVVEAIQRQQETESAQVLFARYQAEGRFRLFAIAGSDPDGTKKAKTFLTKGVAFFREVFDAIPPLVGATAPARPASLPGLNRTANGPQNVFVENQGQDLHERTMAELKAKNLPMAKYAEVSAKFSRQ